MKALQNYWTFSSIRGAATLLASIAIVALPYATSQALSLPILMALILDCWATYCIIDAAGLILLAQMMPAGSGSRKAIYLQSAAGVLVAATLYLTGYDAITIPKVLTIAIAQAAIAALIELRIARDTYSTYRSAACYTTATVLAASIIGLTFTLNANAQDTSLVLSTFIGLYGATQLALGGRMLFIEYRSEHPAPDWLAQSRLAMKDDDLAAARCGYCAQCPADAVCRDYSLKGQMAKVIAGKQPPIVRTVRLTTLLESHARKA